MTLYHKLTNKSSAVAEMGDRGHNRLGPKRGRAAVPFSRGSWVPLQHSVAWAEVYFRTKWRLHPSTRLATIDMNRKLGAVPLLGRGTATPSNTTSPGPRFTSVPSGILIHPAVWPQRTLAENWGCISLGEGELGPHLTQCRLGCGLPPNQVPS